MSFLSLPLSVALMSMASGGDAAPSVQRPSVSPTQPEAGEPAIAPAHVETEAAGQPEPVPADVDTGVEDPTLEPEPGPEPEVEPGPEVQPEPAPESGLPSWNSAPTDPVVDSGEFPATDDWGVPVAPVDHSPPRATGLFWGAGGLFGAMVTKQLIMGLTCDDVYCGYRGNFDRVMGLGVMGFAAGGGWFDGRRRAYFELKDETAQGKLTKRRATGWTLFSLGMAGLLTDMVLYHVCYDGAAGPYRDLEGFSYTCSPVASVVVVDFSTILGAVGLGMGVSAESQLRHRERNKFNLSIAPWGGRGQAGMSISGQF